MNNKTTVKVKKLRRKAASAIKQMFAGNKMTKKQQLSFNRTLSPGSRVEKNIYVTFDEFNKCGMEEIKFKRDISGTAT